MSAVKRKLNSISLTQKCKIIQLIEKGMANKAASEKSEFQETLFPHG